MSQRGWLVALGAHAVAPGLRAQTTSDVTPPRAGEEAEAEVVVARERAEPASASTAHVTGKQVRAMPHRTAEDALRLVPGVTTVQHGSEGKGQQFFVRGFDAMHGSDFEVKVEGLPVNEWSNVHGQGYVDLGFVAPELIQSVAVTKGPFSVQQGAFAMAGSAEYHLGVASDERGVRVAYTIGDTARHRGLVTYAPRVEGSTDFVALEATHDDGFGERRGIDRGTALGRLRLFDSEEAGTLSVFAMGSIARFELPGALRKEDVDAGRVDHYGVYDPELGGSSGRGLAALQHELRAAEVRLSSRAFAGYRELELVENYTGFLIDPENGDRRSQGQRTFAFGASTRAMVRFAPDSDFATELGVRGDVLKSEQRQVDRALEPIEDELAIAATQLLPYVALSLDVEPTRRLRLSGGARIDVPRVVLTDELTGSSASTGTLAVVSPRAVARWQPAETWGVFLAYGRGFRPPEARSLSSFEPEEVGLDEEEFDGGEPGITTADAFEFGMRWLGSRYLGARASSFATLVANEVVYDHVSGLNVELGGTRRLGFELDLHAHPADFLLLSADVTYADARFVASGNPIPFAPWLAGNVDAIFTHDSGLSAGLRFGWMAPRYLPHGARGSSQGVVGMTVGYRSGPLSAQLELENLFDQRVAEGEYHYASDFRTEARSSEIPVIHQAAGPPRMARLTVTAVF